MSRPIDSENLYKFLTDQRVKERGAYSKGVNKGLDIARSALRNEQIAPTLTPQNEWVRVEERLPAPKQNVLAYSHKSGIAEADYADGVWMQYRWSAVMDGVTHWMPLPAPPERQRGDTDHA